MKLIVGLGNPGRRYRGTRHNVGAEAVDRLAQRLGIKINEEDGFARVGRDLIDGTRVLLAIPQTYVNVTGAAVRDLRRRHRVAPKDIFIVVDDIDLPVGRLRLRARGSAGGHNGLKSIIDALGTNEFPRLRVGVGRPPDGVDPAEFVLTRFSPGERGELETVLDKAVEALEVAIREGVPAAMNRFNAGTVDAKS